MWGYKYLHIRINKNGAQLGDMEYSGAFNKDNPTILYKLIFINAIPFTVQSPNVISNKFRNFS